jgi:hypothetical protein
MEKGKRKGRKDKALESQGQGSWFVRETIVHELLFAQNGEHQTPRFERAILSYKK